MMAEATRSREMGALVADHLHKLRASETAGRIMAADPADRDQRGEADALWSRVLRAALTGPEDLRDRD